MSSSLARRKAAEKMNTPKNIEIWNKQFLEQDPDSPIHGDIIQLTKKWNQFEKGTLGLVEINMDSRINSPVMSVDFCEGWGICGPTPDMKYKKNRSISEVSLKRIQQKTFDTQTGGEKDYKLANVNTNRSMRNTIENFAENNDGTRNKRDVWTVPTHPYSGAHFATFPYKLIEPCVLAGCPREGIILDPFFGSGTTGIAARMNDREFIGIELNPDYCKLAENRIREECGLLL